MIRQENDGVEHLSKMRHTWLIFNGKQQCVAQVRRRLSGSV